MSMTAMGWLCALLLAAAPALPAEEWSQFRGPNGRGVAEATGLPVRFGPAQNVIWKTRLPPGHSSPVLGGERVFLTAFEGDKLLTFCLDRGTGAVVWRREVERGRADRLRKPNSPASPSPVTDGRNVYVFFQDFGLLSYGPDGAERWRVPLGPFNTFYGMGASPILVDDLVVQPCDQDTNSFLLAVESRTGRVRWRTERPDVISGYSTPVVVRTGGGEAQIVVPESFQLSAYSARDGRRLWWVRGLACEMKSGLPEGRLQRLHRAQVAIQPVEDHLDHFRVVENVVARVEEHVLLVLFRRAEQPEQGALAAFERKQEVIAAIDHYSRDLDVRRKVERIDFRRNFLEEPACQKNGALEPALYRGEARPLRGAQADAIVG